jgi:hypothetical protein
MTDKTPKKPGQPVQLPPIVVQSEDGPIDSGGRPWSGPPPQ